MGSLFPNNIDSFTDPLANSPLNSPSHAGQHQNLNDAVEKIETYMGLVKVVPTSAVNGTVGATGTVTIGNTVPSVTVNGAFSSLYDNYRIILTTNSGSTDAAFFLRLAGSSTAYYYSDIQNTFAGANGTDKAENTTGWRIGSNDGTNGTFSIVDIMRPNLAQMSFMSFTGIYGDIGGAAWSGQGMHNVASSFTGFEIYPNAGTFTGGAITVYGYRK